MDNLDELVDALIRLIQVKADRDRAFADCDHSWGYYGSGREEELTKAKERFAKAFSNAVKGA